MNSCITIALTKGRLEEKTVSLLQSRGVDVSPLRDKGRKLVFPVKIGDIDARVLLVKPFDVITYVERGICDIGIVGKDTIMEYGKSFFEVADLGFGKCRMVFAGRKEFADNPDLFFNSYGKKIIATKFEKIARDYFNSKNTDVDIIKIEGSVEIAPVMGFAQGIVDIVETGTTLAENGLEIIDVISDISARLIVNVASMKMKKNEIDSILNILGVIEK